MATYYVKPAAQGGNNSLAGTSPATAWATVAYALTSSSGFASGDTLYIAPGVYTDTITITMPNPTAETNIIGDPTASQFSGFTAAPVVITNYNSTLSGSGYTGNIITATTKNYLHFQNIQFKIDNNRLVFTTCTFLKFTKCSFIARHKNNDIITLTSPTSTAVNATITRCVFVGGNQSLNITGQSVADGTSVIDSIFINPSNTAGFLNNVQVAWYNCLISGASYGVLQQPGSLTFPTTVRNCLMFLNAVDLQCVSVNNAIVENYNRLLSPTPRANVANNLTSSSVGDIGVDFFETLLLGLNNVQPYTSYASSPNANFGNATGAPATDIYGVTWTGANPDTGAGTYRVITSVPSNVGYVANLPVNTQATTITVAPASTSQSIELYLGATGLTFATSGLAAYYVRNQSAPVAITLVTQTPTGAWASGGFAEISSSLVPGVYRLDVPNAAFAAGASDVTIVVRGASGTNGAVMTVKLSSGGLTSAQTAAAVWGASPAGYNDATTFGGVVNQIDQTVTGTSVLVQDIPSNVWQEETNDHTTHGTYGYNILRADAPSKEGLVTLHQSGGISRIDADIHAIVNDTAAAAELKGALLHTGGDYITADLLNPVASAQTLRIGPFGVRADGGGADGALDLNQSTAANIVVQMTDGQGTGIDQTSATVQAKVYNVAGALVATYTCTAAYALGGYMSIPMTTTVTGTAGSYIINLWSTVGSTVTVYGPLQLRVRAI
jgi:hypothetical protein